MTRYYDANNSLTREDYQEDLVVDDYGRMLSARTVTYDGSSNLLQSPR